MAKTKRITSQRLNGSKIMWSLLTRYRSTWRYMYVTADYQRDWIKNKERTVAEILQEFPRLLDSNMIEEDYRLAYPLSIDVCATDGVPWSTLSSSMVQECALCGRRHWSFHKI